MICSKCLIQMHQKGKEGAGVSEGNYFETWEIKICPDCKREAREFYAVKILKEGA